MDANHPDRRGTLERHGQFYLLYRRGLGYVSKGGGYSSKCNKARRFEGAGEAIRYAATQGFAVLRYD